MFWPHMGGYGWGGWVGGGLIMLLILGAFVALIYFLVRSGTNNQSSGGQSGGRNDALEILKQRYARGDISKAEYDEMRRDLAT